jgi:hypothetical protein
MPKFCHGHKGSTRQKSPEPTFCCGPMHSGVCLAPEGAVPRNVLPGEASTIDFWGSDELCK